MGLSKSFQIILFVIFGLLLFQIYTIENNEVQIQGEAARKQFTEDLARYSHWTGDGEDLFNTLRKHYSFQFFQYIHQTDSEHNFSYGSLARKQQIFADKLFNIDLGHIQQFPEGRLQVRLDASSVINTNFKELETVARLLIGAYLLLMLIFALLMVMHRRRINYAAQYIDNIGTLSFQAIETSRFKGSLKPLGKALENCRSQLKQNLEVIRLENDQLTKAAFQDPITLFSTRQRFNAYLEKITNSEKHLFGVLVVVKASELANINQLHGRAAGDDYLSNLATCIRKASRQAGQVEIFRVSSGDFAIFIDGITLKEGEKFLEKIKNQFDEYTQISQFDSAGHIGMVPYETKSDPSTLMAMADAAVSIAQTLGPNRYHMLEKFNGNDKFGDDHWKVTINDLINRRSLKFFNQPIQPCNHDTEVYRELLARFYNSEGKHLPTSTVIAMSERHGLSVELDKMIVINTIKLLSENPTLQGGFGVNISATSALQDVFVFWLKDILSHHKQVASRLIFEINEAGMQANLAASYQFVSEVHKVGSKVAVERFGLGFTSFKFFREVRPDFIKLDSSYSDAIEQDNNNKFFVRMIVDIARRIGIRVIATGVERQDEKLTLEKLLVDGLQGYYIAQPEVVTVTK
ncbi:EAL domain-containing protein [Shewanella aestuarii]|uniref:GGDEF domain-containing protein n=1 Tax=Shewanella aestuarii TaxID=1028752 RepID=A0A6G9QKJ1_9GAMM|nr:GGDEF domain-containing protein [Shewanella aestuarii]QIR14653.1 GGDEF domain-containing protein [Shewanella aestuarii]